MRLVRLASPTLGRSNDEPAAATLSIIDGQQHHVVCQLLHKG